MRAGLWMMLLTAVSAAPMLRLSTSVLTAQTAVGASPAGESLQATNTGDGTLSLSVSVPSEITWLTVSMGAANSIQFAFHTASLAAGTYAARVTVSDPKAIDSPQVVIVNLQVGGSSFPPIDRYVAPGTTTDIPVNAGFCFSCPSKVSTSDGGKWLSVTFRAMATIFYYDSIRLAPPASMPDGTYTGSATFGNNLEITVPVTMHVTTLPIAVPSTNQINLRLAQNGPEANFPFLPYISLSNSGMGTLQVTGASGSGSGVSAINYGGLAIVRVFPGSLAPGTYTDGLVTIQCNAANCPVKVPVNLEIVPQGPPAIQYQGAVDNATFSPTGSPGDVMIVKGEQLSLQGPVFVAPPLPTTLGGASVLVNGVATPLYYSSFGQIAFQMRAGTYLGTGTVQVVRDGQASNTISVNIAPFAPGIVVVTDTSYNLIDATHPAKAGQTLVFWVVGLGATDLAVADGAAAPMNPVANVKAPVTVGFGPPLFGYSAVAPSFAGLSPGSVGLYQVMAKVPAGATGNVSAWLEVAGVKSNFVEFTVQ